MTIFGGAEAWKVASKLAAASVNVIITSTRCTPGFWETRDCILPNGIGKGLDYINQKNVSMTLPAAQILTQNGVKVGLGIGETNFARGLLWEASWIYHDSLQSSNAMKKPSLTVEEALGMVTWNVADVTGSSESVGRLAVGDAARFVAYSTNPIVDGFSSKISVITNSDRIVCNPTQD